MSTYPAPATEPLSGRWRLAQLQAVLLELEPPRGDQEEQRAQDGQVEQRCESRAWPTDLEAALQPVGHRHVAARDHDEPQQHGRDHECERKSEDEEPDVSAVDRIRDTEGLPVSPEQVRLPVPLHRAPEQASGEDRHAAMTATRRARRGSVAADLTASARFAAMKHAATAATST